MQQIEPSTLHRSLSEYFAGHDCDGLFIASLDHSPTEQLIGEKWHTSALILSARVETDLLADNVAGLLNEIMRVPQRYPQQYGECTQNAAGLFYWERWMT